MLFCKKIVILLWATLVLFCIPKIDAEAKKVSMKEYRTVEMNYYGAVSEEETELAKQIYARIVNGTNNYITLSFTSKEEEEKILRAIYHVQGNYFYYEPFKFSSFSTAQGVGSISINTQKSKEVLEENKYIRKEVKKIIKKIKINKKMDEKKAITKINSYMKKTYNYDYTYTYRSAYELLKTKKGVCSAYSDLFRYLCNYCGIQSSCVIGNNGTHEWNKVRCNNKWYYTDVTWNDTARTNKYLLMSKSKLNRIGEHTIDYVVQTSTYK